MNLSTGPFVKAACFCEVVIEGKDGVLSLIRVVDIITRQAQGTDVPDEMPQDPYPLKMVIMLNPGMARGRHKLHILPEDPRGLRNVEREVELSVHFEEGRTANLIADLQIDYKYEGTYLFHIVLDEDHLTSIPLTIRYHRIKRNS